MPLARSARHWELQAALFGYDRAQNAKLQLSNLTLHIESENGYDFRPIAT